MLDSFILCRSVLKNMFNVTFLLFPGPRRGGGGFGESIRWDLKPPLETIDFNDPGGGEPLQLCISVQSGLKSNLPRDDINLQFCRGQLKLKKDMLTDMMQQEYTKFRYKYIFYRVNFFLFKIQVSILYNAHCPGSEFEKVLRSTSKFFSTK